MSKELKVSTTLVDVVRSLVGDGGLHENDCYCDNTHEAHGTKCLYCSARTVLAATEPADPLTKRLEAALRREIAYTKLEANGPYTANWSERRLWGCANTLMDEIDSLDPHPDGINLTTCDELRDALRSTTHLASTDQE